MSLFTLNEFNAFTSTFPGVTHVDQWESRVAKVGGKVFALLSQEGDQNYIAFKCSELSFVILTAIEGIRQAPYFAKRQWVSVGCSAELPETDLQGYITQSHQIVAKGLTKKLQRELGIEQP